jgi:hypothetical protein
LDEGCFRLGVDRGNDMKKGTVGYSGAQTCQREFQQGQAVGFASDFSRLTAGSECFNAGVSAGLARLTSGARLGDKGTVGVACVEEFNRGVSDGRASRVSQPLLEPKESTCYEAGYFDGGLFRTI